MKFIEAARYTPKPLRFGTSGVRGLVEELRDIEVYAFVRGCLDFFEQRGLLSRQNLRPPIPIAGDLRSSTPRILEAVAQAILDHGLSFDFCGTIPTPALTLYGLEQGVASFMVTGSHIPADRNGIKPNRSDGEVLKEDEKGILEAVSRWREKLYQTPLEDSPFDREGQLKRRPELGRANTDAAELYRKRYRCLPKNALKGLRLLFFEYSAVGRDLLPEMLRSLGAEVVVAGRSEAFFPIDTEAISEEHLALFQKLTAEKGDRFDAVLSTDGDSDRPLLVDFSQEKPQMTNNFVGQFIWGDLLGALVAVELGVDAAVVPISAHPALDGFLAQNGIKLVRTRIGSPYVIAEMKQLRKAGFQRVVGWEANGGFLVGTEIPYGDGVFRPLPTRDSFLPMVLLLSRAVRLGKPLRELLAPFGRIEGRSLLIDPFPEELRAFFERFRSPDGAVEVDFRSGSEGQWEYWQGEVRRLEALFQLGPIERLNLLDGVRMVFTDGSVVHLRPSGNAPQLRAYLFAPGKRRLAELERRTLAVIDRLV